jgi:carboxyl-terminal processing protease
MKKIQAWLPLLLSVVMILGMFTGYQLYREIGGQNQASNGGPLGFLKTSRGNSLQQVLDLIELKYVDTIETGKLEISGIEALIANLDPHSQYIPAKKMADVTADLSGNFSGIGVEYQLIEDTVIVVAVIDKGPADLAGLQEGDALISVDDSTIAGVKITPTQLRSLLRGQANSQVDLKVWRNKKLLVKTVQRGNIPQPSVDAYYMMDTVTGYIKLNRFAETTYFEFMDAATALQKAGMKKMVLDLRGNGGGLLEEATNIADELLEDGSTIVSMRGKGIKSQIIYSTKPGIFEKGALAVLIDEQSASASEVLAAALQENDRATIIGRRSFGKGLVQEQYPLANQGALRLTVARYYTPLGRSIQKPYDENKTAYQHEVVERYTNGNSLLQTDTIGKKRFTTRKGKNLYEGGGVTPDYSLPIDSMRLTVSLVDIYNSGKLLEETYRMFHRDKNQVIKFKNPVDFYRNYRLNPTDITKIEQLGRGDSLPAIKLSADDKKLLEIRVKALIARYYWRSNAFFQLLNMSDPTVQFALRLIDQPLKKAGS